MAAERIKGWQCIGCGKVEAPRSCIGVCQDRPVELVAAFEYDAVLARMQALEGLVRQLAMTTPRTGEWERSYRALQARARLTLALPARPEAA